MRRLEVGLSLSLLLSCAAALFACDSGDSSDSSGGQAVTPTGCTPASGAKPATAPDGYYVNGNTLCTPSGRAHLLHGVDRPSLEWDANGEDLSASDFKTMASWHANVVRVALNQDFWLSESPVYSSGYAPRVDQVVQWAEQAGLDVILDLHWSDQGTYEGWSAVGPLPGQDPQTAARGPGQQVMADEHSLEFWKEVAARYASDGRVFFELYNEPHDVTPEVWLSGGSTGSFTAVGMQQLYDAVRGVGANNPVIVGGLDYAYDLRQVATMPVVGYNILYATHPYNNAPERQPDEWFNYWGYLASTAPVVVTEFGDGTGDCSPDWDQELIPFADQLHVSWTAWAWWAGDCKFPSLLTDWTYDTTNEGAVVKAALLGYDDPAALGAEEAGAPDADAPDAGDAGSEDAGSEDAGDDAPADAGAEDADTGDAMLDASDGGADAG